MSSRAASDLVLDNQEEKAHIEDVSFPHEVCGKLRKGIEVVNVDIIRQPFLGWAFGRCLDRRPSL